MGCDQISNHQLLEQPVKISMKTILKLIILPVLHIVREIITVLLRHAIPSPSVPTPPPTPYPVAYDFYSEVEMRNCYDHFKQYFSDAIFLDTYRLREYAINEAISNHHPDYHYLEFGVRNGISLNQFSEILKAIQIYGFDSFEGFKEDWKGVSGVPKGSFSLHGQIPKLNNNCVPVVGWIQETLPTFISDNRDLKINFMHIDTDTYPTAKFILQQTKPYLLNDSIIVFDELYNHVGWRVGEYKALTELFDEEEYEFLVFSRHDAQAVIQYKKL